MLQLELPVRLELTTYCLQSSRTTDCATEAYSLEQLSELTDCSFVCIFTGFETGSVLPVSLGKRWLTASTIGSCRIGHAVGDTTYTEQLEQPLGTLHLTYIQGFCS